MTTRIAFLRAVNLGKRTVKMPRVVEIVGGLGYDHVWTHINSGNVVLEATGNRRDLEHRIETALEGEFGFEVTTFVRTAAELRSTLAAKPFRVAPSDTYFVTFLKATPSPAQRAALEGLSNDFDTLVVEGSDVHWLMHGKSTDSRLTTKAWERIIGRHRSTSRNTTMLQKLSDKIEATR
jgi:uncharacterized protein (DUF1697 family)